MTWPVNSTPPSLKYDVHWVKPVKCGIKINCDAVIVLKTEPGREPEKGVVPVLVVRPGSDRWSNQ
jgi:hypothetical protein